MKLAIVLVLAGCGSDPQPAPAHPPEAPIASSVPIDAMPVDAADHLEQHPIDTGAERPSSDPKEVRVAIGDATGDVEGLTTDEINRVMRARTGLFRACYQKELAHKPGIAGKIVMHFKIAADGTVSNASTTAGTTLHDAAIVACLTSNIMRLKFPAKGPATVNFPFVFSGAN